MRKSWARRGQQAAVLLSGQNARRVIFGGLELHTGQRLFLVRPRQQLADFGQWLLLLRHHRGPGPLALILDENSTHTSPINQRLALWRWGKQHLSANRQDADIDTLARAFVEGLRRLSPEETLRRAGVLSEGFWLKRVPYKLFCLHT